jgi:hypothetical protein
MRWYNGFKAKRPGRSGLLFAFAEAERQTPVTMASLFHALTRWWKAGGIEKDSTTHDGQVVGKVVDGYPS